MVSQIAEKYMSVGHVGPAAGWNPKHQSCCLHRHFGGLGFSLGNRMTSFCEGLHSLGLIISRGLFYFFFDCLECSGPAGLQRQKSH